jgi:hypothetical protein
MTRYAQAPPAVLQLEIHPFLTRARERSYAKKHGIVVQAYGSVVQQGRRDIIDHPITRRIAEILGPGSSPGAVLLKWALQHGMVALPKSSQPFRLAENLRAADSSFSLTDEHMSSLDALSCDPTRGACAAPYPTGCGLWCPHGEYLWSPDVVPAKAGVFDWASAVQLPFVESLDLGGAAADDGVVEVARRKGSAQSTPLFQLPWLFDVEQLQREVLEVAREHDWEKSEYGHALPLLEAAELSGEFLSHFINLPHMRSGQLDRCCPLMSRIKRFFTANTELISMRLLRRQPLTAYGLHNDEDLHVHPNIRRFQIPVETHEQDALLLTTPFSGLMDLAAARGPAFANENELLSQHAWPLNNCDRHVDWFQRAECVKMEPGGAEGRVRRNVSASPAHDDGYAYERRRLEDWVRDFAELGSVYELAAGRMHHFDTMRRHTLVNLGARTRITLVLDLLDNDWMKLVMPTITQGVKSNLQADANGVEQLKRATQFRDWHRNGHLGFVSLELPFNGTILEGPYIIPALRTSLETPEHHRAFKAFCGHLVNEPAYQYAPEGCHAYLSQHSTAPGAAAAKTAELPSLINRYDLALDRGLCFGGACKLSVRVVDSTGVDILRPSTTVVYLAPPAVEAEAVAGAGAGVDAVQLVSPHSAARFADLAFAQTHGAAGQFLGSGMVYYSLAYAQRAKLSVVLGSGGGFVPSLIRTGQLDSMVGAMSRTVLIDAAIGSYGRPNWLDGSNRASAGNPFVRHFDVELVVERTDRALASFAGLFGNQTIDLLVIDADHSHRGSLNDALGWLPHLSPSGIALLHGKEPCLFFFNRNALRH